MLRNDRSQQTDHSSKAHKVVYNLNTDTATPRLTLKNQRNNFNGRQPSKLELLRADYQMKILKEKEAKLIQIYEDNQKKAMIKTSRNTFQDTQNDDSSSSDRISVREFFIERRRMEASGIPMPTVQNHYLLVGSSPSSHEWSSNAGSSNSFKTQKPNFGIDRLQPLAPIQRAHQTQEMNSTPVKARGEQNSSMEVSRDRYYSHFSGNSPFQTHKSLSATDSHFAHKENKESSLDHTIPSFGASSVFKLAHHSKTLPQQQLQPILKPPSSASDFRFSENDTDSHDGDTDKLTDFQKWRMKQTLEGRLKEMNVTKNSSYKKQGKWKQLNNNTAEDWENNIKDVKSFDYNKNATFSGRCDLQKMTPYELKELEKIRMASEKEEENKRQKEDQISKQTAKREGQTKLDNDRKTSKYRKREDNNNLVDTPSKIVMKSAQREVVPPHNGGLSFKQTAKSIPDMSRSQDFLYEIDSAHLARADIPLFDIKHHEQANSLYVAESSMAKCQLCGRSFFTDRLEKHQVACARVNKPRKEFDSSKKRVEGTDLAMFTVKAKRPEPTKKKSNWRAKHEEFIQSLRYAKKVTQFEKEGKDVTQLTPAEVFKNPDYVMCSHCGRTFNQTAAERHIPRCQSLKTRPPPVNTRRR